jgi:ATP synthase F0 subcomplex A subunit
MAAVTFWPAMTEEPHQPGILDFFPDAIFGDGTFFSFNRVTLARVIVAVVLCVVLGIAASRAKLVPTRGQLLVEMLAEFVRRSIGIEMLGESRGRRFAPCWE